MHILPLAIILTNPARVPICETGKKKTCSVPISAIRIGLHFCRYSDQGIGVYMYILQTTEPRGPASAEYGWGAHCQDSTATLLKF